MNGQPTSPAPWHVPTAIGLGAFAWILLMAGHEILGHGTACVALGGDAISVDAMYFSCTELSAPWKDQLYRAAGSVFNLLLAVSCLIGLRRISEPRSWLGYFLWITAILNLLQAGSYVGFGRFIHPGMDWAMIVAGAPQSARWATGVTAAGVALLVSALVVGRRYEPLFFHSVGGLRRQRARLLLTPYLTAAAVSIAASIFVPSDDRFMMLMGGIGNSLFFLAPMLLLLVMPIPRDRVEDGGPDFSRRPVVIASSVAVTLLYVFVLGAGIGG